MMKKLVTLMLAFALTLSLVACTGTTTTTDTKKDTTAAEATTGDDSASTTAAMDPDPLIGLSMPTHSDESWIRHSKYTMQYLQEMGYTKFDEQWAEDVIESQVSQIENMITKGVKILIVAAVNGEALGEVLQKAEDAGIIVIAYDRMLMKTENVDYYVTFDNYKVGVAEADYIVEKLGLKDGKGPFNIELFGGSLDDSNSKYFYQGAFDVLKPYIDGKQLVVKSNQVDLETVATPGWDAAKAQSRMDNILTANYSDGSRVDAVLVPYDGLSIGVIASLKNTGYGTAELPLPIVTGQDAEVASIISIINGEQTQTVWKDFRVQAKACAEVVDAIIKGTEVPVNDTTTYDNGVKIIPTFSNPVTSIDINNYMTLFDAGFYNKEDDVWKGLVK